MAEPTLTSRSLTTVHCVRLRHKGMYVGQDPVAYESEYDRDWLGASAYWCLKTQKSFGPDGGVVTAEACCGDRGCCEH
jgi:hypothetical protein